MTTAAPVSTKAAHGLSICPPFYFKSQFFGRSSDYYIAERSDHI